MDDTKNCENQVDPTCREGWNEKYCRCWRKGEMRGQKRSSPMGIETIADWGSVEVLYRCKKRECCSSSWLNKRNGAPAVEHELTFRREATTIEVKSMEPEWSNHYKVWEVDGDWGRRWQSGKSDISGCWNCQWLSLTRHDEETKKVYDPDKSKWKKTENCERYWLQIYLESMGGAERQKGIWSW